VQEENVGESQITVSGLESKIESLAKLRQSYNEAKDKASEINSQVEQLENQILADLESLGKTSYHSEAGVVTSAIRSSVKTPKDLESKRLLFDYLREKGIFEEMVSINSATLNALYKRENEAAIERGELLFKLPGIPEVTNSVELRFRKK